MAYTHFRPRGDTKTNWETVNPVLGEREMGIEWEEQIGYGYCKIKFGTGYTEWNDLDYAVVNGVGASFDSDTKTITLE